MRALGTIVISAIVAGLIAGVLQVRLAISFNAHEEFIGVMFGQVLFIIIASGLFWVAIGIFETTSAIDRVAIGLAGVLVLGIVGVEAFALTAFNQKIGPREMLAADGPIILEIAAPALLAVLVQWWWVRRYLKNKLRREAVA